MDEMNNNYAPNQYEPDQQYAQPQQYQQPYEQQYQPQQYEQQYAQPQQYEQPYDQQYQQYQQVSAPAATGVPSAVPILVLGIIGAVLSCIALIMLFSASSTLSKWTNYYSVSIISGAIGTAVSGTVFAIAGIIVSAIGLGKSNGYVRAGGQKSGKSATGRILSRVGLIQSIIVTAIVLIVLILLIIAVSSAANSYHSWSSSLY